MRCDVVAVIVLCGTARYAKAPQLHRDLSDRQIMYRVDWTVVIRPGRAPLMDVGPRTLDCQADQISAVQFNATIDECSKAGSVGPVPEDHLVSSASIGGVTLYVLPEFLHAYLGCDAVYTSMGGDLWNVDVFAQHSQCRMQTKLQIFYAVVHQKSVLYVDSASLTVRILL